MAEIAVSRQLWADSALTQLLSQSRQTSHVIQWRVYTVATEVICSAVLHCMQSRSFGQDFGHAPRKMVSNEQANEIPIHFGDALVFAGYLAHARAESGGGRPGGYDLRHGRRTKGAIRKLVSTSGPVRALVTVSVGSQLSGQVDKLDGGFQ